MILAFTFLLIFLISCEAPFPRILQDNTQDLSLPTHSFSPTSYYHVFYELSPPGNITIAVQFDKPDQVFSLGLGAGMVGADIWAFEIINGKIVAGDYHGVGFTMPVLDTSSRGQDNLEILGTKVTSTSSFVKFTRALDTGDSQNDNVIRPGPTFFIWSTATGSPTLVYHGPNCGSLQVDLVTEAAPVVNPGETEIGGAEEEASMSEEGEAGENSEMSEMNEIEVLEVGEGLLIL